MVMLYPRYLAALYALPNIYGEDPAVQLRGARGASVDLSTLDAVTDSWNKGLSCWSVLERFHSYSFNDTDTQISARDISCNKT